MWGDGSSSIPRCGGECRPDETNHTGPPLVADGQPPGFPANEYPKNSDSDSKSKIKDEDAVNFMSRQCLFRSLSALFRPYHQLWSTRQRRQSGRLPAKGGIRWSGEKLSGPVRKMVESVWAPQNCWIRALFGLQKIWGTENRKEN